MKKILIIGTAVIFMGAGQMCGCGSCEAKANTVEKTAEVEKTKIVKLKITGMTCGGCASKVSKALSKIEGVIKEDIAYPGDRNTITYDPKKTSEEAIIKAIEKTGYKAEVIKTKN